MNAFMTIDEVFTHYSDKWVLLDDLESRDGLTVQGGRVVAHDPVRSVVEAAAIRMRLERCVIVCTKQKDGKDAIARDYAVSTITSAEEIESVVGSIG